jgi:hypothetical protein
MSKTAYSTRLRISKIAMDVGQKAGICSRDAEIAGYGFVPQRKELRVVPHAVNTPAKIFRRSSLLNQAHKLDWR